MLGFHPMIKYRVENLGHFAKPPGVVGKSRLKDKVSEAFP